MNPSTIDPTVINSLNGALANFQNQIKAQALAFQQQDERQKNPQPQAQSLTLPADNPEYRLQQKKTVNDKYTAVKRNYNSYIASLTSLETSNDYLDKLDSDKLASYKSMDSMRTATITNERKSYYERQKMNILKNWYLFITWAYFFVVGILAITVINKMGFRLKPVLLSVLIIMLSLAIYYLPLAYLFTNNTPSKDYTTPVHSSES